jgi:hypothetical protein
MKLYTIVAFAALAFAAEDLCTFGHCMNKAGNACSGGKWYECVVFRSPKYLVESVLIFSTGICARVTALFSVASSEPHEADMPFCMPTFDWQYDSLDLWSKWC